MMSLAVSLMATYTRMLLMMKRNDTVLCTTIRLFTICITTHRRCCNDLVSVSCDQTYALTGWAVSLRYLPPSHHSPRTLSTTTILRVSDLHISSVLQYDTFMLQMCPLIDPISTSPTIADANACCRVFVK